MAEIRDRYDYVIVGGGVAADKAARAIRKRDEDASIAIFSDEADEPVYRPELSKGLWFGDDPTPPPRRSALLPTPARSSTPRRR